MMVRRNNNSAQCATHIHYNDIIVIAVTKFKVDMVQCIAGQLSAARPNLESHLTIESMNFITLCFDLCLCDFTCLPSCSITDLQHTV